MDGWIVSNASQNLKPVQGAFLPPPNGCWESWCNAEMSLLKPFQLIPYANTIPCVNIDFSKLLQQQKYTRSVLELMAIFKHIRSGRSGWSNQQCLERKFYFQQNDLITADKSTQKENSSALMWSLAAMKQLLGKQEILESRAPGIMECARTHPASFMYFQHIHPSAYIT